MVLVSCSSDEPTPEPDPVIGSETAERAILVYAVNNSNLSDSFVADSIEMLKAVKEVNDINKRLVVYCTDKDRNGCTLYEATKVDDARYNFTSLIKYDRNVMSTHPERISAVINDFTSLYPNAAYDLIFWGHGTSWKYNDSDHMIDTPTVQAYGGESNKDWTNIDELAAAIPDNKFETIWFDCCYMSGIEVIYQFRNKCHTFVGYPTEVWEGGMAYDETLPYLMRETPDITGAAEAFFNFYKKRNRSATVTVLDISQIEPLADAVRAIIENGDIRPESSQLLNYSRDKMPFYDLRQFMAKTAELNADSETATTLTENLDRALANMVLYMDASDRNFSKVLWNRDNISGISTHFFKDSSSQDDEYYRTLDWYTRLYKPIP